MKLRSVVCAASAAFLSMALTRCGEREDVSDLAALTRERAAPLCRPVEDCEPPPLEVGAPRPFQRSASGRIAGSFPRHRGRDLFVRPGEPQWIIGKFSYGVFDQDLKGEEVDLYRLREDCGAWVPLGTAVTTDESQHPTVEGVEDTGGRVYFEIPEAERLPVGRHRLRLVVAGDGTTTDLFIEVVPPGTRTFVSDVDGTLTRSEYEEFTALLGGGRLPEPHPDAAEALWLLAQKGYRPLYLTARPEPLVDRTRAFLTANGFPPGIVRTTLGLTGATGAPAQRFKREALDALGARGLSPEWAFGNKGTDAEAYAAVPELAPERRVFFQFSDENFGGRRVEGYGELVPEFQALEAVCRAPSVE